MARMRFKNAWNYDSAARQVDTGDFDFILDTDTDVGYAFSLVVNAAIAAGLASFTANFINDNDLLTQADADTLYELIGAITAHVAAMDPHSQYLTPAEGNALYEALGAAAAAIVAHNAAGDPHPQYLTPAEGNALYEVLGAAAAAIVSHNAAGDPHPGYLTPAEGNALYEPAGGGGGAVGVHEAAADPHLGYQKESEKAAASGYAPLNVSSDLPLTHLPDHTHVDSSTGGTISVFATRATVTKTTASLANLAEETGTLAVAAGYRLLKIDVDRACRVRLYTTSAKRTSDSARAVGTDIDIATDHGLVLEYVAGAAISADLEPAVDGYCPTGTDAFYAIQNRSGSASTVTVIFTWIRTE